MDSVLACFLVPLEQQEIFSENSKPSKTSKPRRNSEASKEVKEGLRAQHMILESFEPLQCNALWRRRFLFSDFLQPCNTPGNVIDMCEVGLRRNDVGLVRLITEVLQQCHCCWLMFGVSTVQPSAGQH